MAREKRAKSQSTRQQRPVLSRLRPTVLRWTPQTIYPSLLHLFGEQHHDRVRPVAPPFTPSLNAREFQISRDLYIAARLAIWLERLRRHPRKPETVGNERVRLPDRGGRFDEV